MCVCIFIIALLVLCSISRVLVHLRVPIRCISNFLTSVIIIVHYAAVLPSIGIGSLFAREAEGRSNTTAGEKVMP